MKLAIITRADESVQVWIELTHPIFKNFAKKWNTDFIVLDRNHEDSSSDHARIWRRNVDGLKAVGDISRLPGFFAGG